MAEIWRFTGVKASVPWRSAESLVVLGRQIDGGWPTRAKAVDGTIASKQHSSANPTSDHEPRIMDGGKGVVLAMDITHDPRSGADMAKVTEALRLSRDRRIKYVIFNHRIFSEYSHAGFGPFVWRPYFGSSPHEDHTHVSTLSSKTLYDDRTSWAIAVGRSLVTPADDDRDDDLGGSSPTYVVQRGDTMKAIAARFGMTLAALVTANPQIPDPDQLFPGQVLKLARKEPRGDGPPRPAGAATYVVQPGDTMKAIAGRFGATVGALVSANPQIPNPDELFPGQVLNIPRPG